MEGIMKAKDILKIKGPEVITIGTNRTLHEAIEVLTNNNIGVLLVINEDGKLSGIMSERDIIRAIGSNFDTFSEIKVSDIMTRKIIYADTEDPIEYLETIMTNNRIRHIPILHHKVLVGLVSIGDVVKHMLSDVVADNKYMFDMISGNVK
jgi:CBS domain-containing protein